MVYYHLNLYHDILLIMVLSLKKITLSSHTKKYECIYILTVRLIQVIRLLYVLGASRHGRDEISLVSLSRKKILKIVQ